MPSCIKQLGMCAVSNSLACALYQTAWHVRAALAAEHQIRQLCHVFCHPAAHQRPQAPHTRAPWHVLLKNHHRGLAAVCHWRPNSGHRCCVPVNTELAVYVSGRVHIRYTHACTHFWRVAIFLWTLILYKRNTLISKMTLFLHKHRGQVLATFRNSMSRPRSK